MIGIGINLLTQVAKNVLVGAVTTKVVDTVITAKLNKNSDHQKWRRETKLEFFTKLTQKVLSFDLLSASSNEERNLKELCSKVMLVLDDKKLILKIEEYLKELNNTQRALIFSENNTILVDKFNDKSLNLVLELNNNLKRS